MTTLTINLPQHIYERLRTVAIARDVTVQTLVEDLVVAQTPSRAPKGERDRIMTALRAAGKLSEPSAALQQLAADSTLTLDEARAILDRAGGPPLSDLILAMRGPKS